MYLEFTKINTSHPTTTSQVIVDADEIMLISYDTFRNLDTQSQYDCTRVDVLGHPVYSFHTLSTIDQIHTVVPMIDVRGNVASTNSSCIDPNSLDIVYPVANFPLIRLTVIHNNRVSESEEHVINPNHIVWAEATVFNDQQTNQQVSALLLCLRDTGPRRIISTLPFLALELLLSPALV
jgi:hypothetical protein